MAEKAPLNPQPTRSDEEEAEDLFQVSVQPVTLEVPGYQPTPEKASESGSHNIPFLPSGSASSSAPEATGGSQQSSSIVSYNTLNEPVTDTLKRDLLRIVANLRSVVFPDPNRQGPSTPLRDWDLWGPFFFIIFLALVLSSSASENKSEVFAVVFGVLSLGAIVLTLNVLLLGGKIIFFQSLSVLGYCLFPIDVGALICLFLENKLIRFFIVVVTLAWSSWAAYPFVSGAVAETRKALAVYPVMLLYISMGFLVLAND